MNVARGAWVEHVMGLPAFLGEVFAQLRRIDALLSTYRPGSQISRLAAGELTVTECDPLIGEVLALCEQAHAVTGGAFDPLLTAPDGGYVLDPSGLVKGWAVDRAGRRIGECFDGDYYINAGGGLLGVLPLTGGGVATSGTIRRARTSPSMAALIQPASSAHQREDIR